MNNILELINTIKDKQSKGINCDIEINLLIIAFDGIIKCIVNKFDIHESIDEYMQDGRLGLLKAIDSFDVNKNVSFKTYASSCIRNSIVDSLRSHNHHKNEMIEKSISIEDMDEEMNATFRTPEDVAIEKELYQSVKNNISEYQNKVLDLYLQGYSYEEMARQLGKATKDIDNAIQSIKKNIKKLSLR